MNLASKNLSRVEKEELKRKEEEKKTADVLKDFVASFEGGGKSSVKTFVRGGVVNSGKSKIFSILILIQHINLFFTNFSAIFKV